VVWRWNPDRSSTSSIVGAVAVRRPAADERRHMGSSDGSPLAAGLGHPAGGRQGKAGGHAVDPAVRRGRVRDMEKAVGQRRAEVPAVGGPLGGWPRPRPAPPPAGPDPAAKAYQQALFQQRQPAVMFFTDDVQADHERIQARGADFTMPPTKVTGSTIAQLNDTCGNVIQITQLAPQ